MIPSLTHDLVTEFIVCAQANGRRAQAFGELVTLLWAKRRAATVRLEFLWRLNIVFSLM
jgi:hypothetical protein